MTPTNRIRVLNDAPTRPDRAYVLYWMTAFRRTQFNFALDHAIDLAREHDTPLVVLEGLRIDYRWASQRHHAFVLDGMRANARRFERRPVRYLPFVEREPGGGRGLLMALAGNAVRVVADDAPFFFLPRMLAAAAPKLDVRLDAVDSNGLVPLQAVTRVHKVAHAFRREIHALLPELLEATPRIDPLASLDLPTLPDSALPDDIGPRWPVDIPDVESVAVSDDVPATAMTGGHTAASQRLSAFLRDHLGHYAEERNHPDAGATSGLSPYLHFGHIGPHEVFDALRRAEDWTPASFDLDATGSRTGFWGMSEGAEAFLDQLVTWRELGFNRCAHTDDFAEYASLPEWARETLEAHADDPREHLYELAALARAETHDPLWNAAQRELLETGTMHNYLRMLWGKKVLEWSPTPQDALDVLIELNNRYALDGRDPNSYSGIMWIFGRYDRPWGPERAIFGKVRYMSSKSARRKLRLRRYLSRYAGPHDHNEQS